MNRRKESKLWCGLKAAYHFGLPSIVLGIFAAAAFAQFPTPIPPVSASRALTLRAPVNSSEDAQIKAEIMSLANKIEAATVRGDFAYVDSALSPDFTMIHGDGWTHGAKVFAADNKTAYLARVKNHEYVVHDIDPSSIHFEIHGDVVITYGRYVSLFMPPNRNTAHPPELNSIWFERVYQKQNGKWMYLSHRTVRVALSPAGIDPGEVTTLTMFVQSDGFNRGGSYTFEGNGTGRGYSLPIAPRLRGPIREKTAGAGGSAGMGAGPGSAVAEQRRAQAGSGVESPTNTSADAEEVLALERKIGEAVVAGDTAFFDSVTSPNFQMTHGNIWTRGGIPPLVDSKESFEHRIKVEQYLAFYTDPSMQKVELHGNVAVTFGRYIATLRGWDPKTAWFSCWYERVFEKQNGKWIYLSHRTVHDPARGPTRESVSDK